MDLEFVAMGSSQLGADSWVLHAVFQPSVFGCLSCCLLYRVGASVTLERMKLEVRKVKAKREGRIEVYGSKRGIRQRRGPYLPLGGVKSFFKFPSARSVVGSEFPILPKKCPVTNLDSLHQSPMRKAH